MDGETDSRKSVSKVSQSFVVTKTQAPTRPCTRNRLSRLAVRTLATKWCVWRVKSVYRTLGHVTLIVAVATKNYALHASDRYTSIQPIPKEPRRDWDMHANKTIVTIGADCWLVLGYTGLAYLDGKPTDQLIAEAISGHPDLSSGAPFTPWSAPLPHYREIRDRVEHKIADAYSRLPKATADKYPTLVLASGVQRKDKKFHGVMFEIKVHGSTSSSREIVPKLSAVGWCQIEVIDRLDAKIPTAESAEELRDMMMDTVIETSQLTDEVGEDVMGVILDKRTNTIKSHFRPAKPERQAKLLAQVGHLGDQFKQMASVSTPYVLIPGVIFKPSIGVPVGWAMDSGINFEYSGFDIDGPAAGGGFLAGQPRKPEPR